MSKSEDRVRALLEVIHYLGFSTNLMKSHNEGSTLVKRELSSGYLLSVPDETGHIQGNYHYLDQDGVSVLVSILGNGEGEVVEVELWRGDGRSLVRFPLKEDLLKAPLERPF